MAGEPEAGSVDAHAIQPFYAGMVARAAAMAVSFSIDGESRHHPRDAGRPLIGRDTRQFGAFLNRSSTHPGDTAPAIP